VGDPLQYHHEAGKAFAEASLKTAELNLSRMGTLIRLSSLKIMNLLNRQMIRVIGLINTGDNHAD